MITISAAVASLRPDVEWVLRGEDVENIEYITANVVPVTRAEVDAEIIRLEKASTDKAAATAAATAAAKSLGFTDAMIAVMYPNLGSAA